MREPDPLSSLEQTVAEGLQLQAAMLAALPRNWDGLPGRRQREWALAPAFDVLLQLLPVLKALGSPQGALQVWLRVLSPRNPPDPALGGRTPAGTQESLAGPSRDCMLLCPSPGPVSCPCRNACHVLILPLAPTATSRQSVPQMRRRSPACLKLWRMYHVVSCPDPLQTLASTSQACAP